MTDALTWIKSVCRQTDRARRQNTKETLCGGAKTKANLDRRGSAARRQQRNNGKAKLSCSTMRCAALLLLPCPASAAALPLLLSILSSVLSHSLPLALAMHNNENEKEVEVWEYWLSVLFIINWLLEQPAVPVLPEWLSKKRLDLQKEAKLS